MSGDHRIVDRQIIDRVVPRQQTDWDIRGALNFMLGGPGGGLLVGVALATSLGADLRLLVLLAMALVGAGLFSVLLKIGRPLRALFVFRRPSTSWMTREAIIATVLFAAGAAAVWFDRSPLYWIAGLLGLAFVYAQARILRANIGIPAWRHASLVNLVVATGLVEGLAMLCIAALFWPGLKIFVWLLAALVAARYLLWRRYQAALRATGAPSGTMTAFAALQPGFVWGGHAAPLALAVAAAAGAPTALAAFAGLLALAAGAWFKYVLVRRAAFTQGFALPRMPSRGRSRPGPGLQPGWEPPRGGQ